MLKLLEILDFQTEKICLAGNYGPVDRAGEMVLDRIREYLFERPFAVTVILALCKFPFISTVVTPNKGTLPYLTPNDQNAKQGILKTLTENSLIYLKFQNKECQVSLIFCFRNFRFLILSDRCTTAIAQKNEP